MIDDTPTTNVPVNVYVASNAPPEPLKFVDPLIEMLPEPEPGVDTVTTLLLTVNATEPLTGRLL